MSNARLEACQQTVLLHRRKMGATLQDAYQLQREGKTMTAKKAHAFLKAWRAKHSRPAAPQGDGGPAAPLGNAPWGMPQPRKPLVAFVLEVEDLTESPHFDWRAYVAARAPADLAAVFEDQSIERFNIRFIKPVDRNFNQYRSRPLSTPRTA